MNDAARADTPVFSVASLVDAARRLLEKGFGRVAVEGEISNLARPRSGHVYFTLKDRDAQLRCAFFRREAARTRFRLADGLQVLARGRVSIYAARGSFQLIVSQLEQAGLGALQRAFEALKKKLSEEGLFDSEQRRSLPDYPRRIGVVTSRSAAALGDILNVLGRRFRAADVLIFPTEVQGDKAADGIVAALERASARSDCDVLILARGGGSLEDLWPFNEERVARAIHATTIPVVTGVGHETDFTIADLVADMRAPTPSAAAEASVPDAAELGVRIADLRGRLVQAWQRTARAHRQALAALAHRLALQHPRRRLQERSQRVDELSERLRAAAPRLLGAHQSRLAALRAQLMRRSPGVRLERRRMQLAQLRSRLANACRRDVRERRNALEILRGQLHALGPAQTLARGYAIVFDTDGRVLRDVEALEVGDAVRARLARGAFGARVQDTETPNQ